MKPKQKSGVVIIVTTGFLVILKGLVWWQTGSIAVQSELFNSSVDLVYSFIIISGFLLSHREKSSNYPEGLIRLEPLISIIVAGAIILTGISIAYTAITQLLYNSVSTTQHSLAIGVLFISGLTKYSLYRYLKTKSEAYNSPSLAATAIDTRNDVLTASIALIGVGGFYIGYPTIESVTAIIISSYIMYSGVRVAEENLQYALGQSVSETEKQKICNAALQTTNVNGLHDVEIHYTGPLLDISMHIEVPGGLSIEQAHKIELKTADNIRDCAEEPINEINIHTDPESLNEWKNSNW